LNVSLAQNPVRTSFSNPSAQKLAYSILTHMEPVQSINDYRQWIEYHVNQQTDESPVGNSIAELDDADGDGLSNETEFLIGTNPFITNSLPLETSLTSNEYGESIVEMSLEVFRERGDIDLQILAVPELGGQFTQEMMSPNVTPLDYGREKRGIQLIANREAGFFIFKINN
jgi:hypothetical protein